MLPQGKQLCTTIIGDCASSLPDADVGTVAQCIQEEADTGISTCGCYHRRWSSSSDCTTSDSDVVIDRRLNICGPRTADW